MIISPFDNLRPVAGVYVLWYDDGRKTPRFRGITNREGFRGKGFSAEALNAGN